MMNRTDSRFQLLPVALAMVLAFLLAGCQPTPPAATPSTELRLRTEPVEVASPPAPTAAPTDTPLPMAMPTATATPTSTPLPPTATPPLPPSPLPPTDTPTPAMDDAPMVRVPAGEFIMGTSYEEIAGFQDTLSERWGPRMYNKYDSLFLNEIQSLPGDPRQIVYLEEFSIDQYEVTNDRYRRCEEAGICDKHPVSSATREHYYDDPAYGDYPVIGVSWEDAQTYCHWVGKRLPTEAEWEKAARGTDGRWWPWGNEWTPGLANTSNSWTPARPEVQEFYTDTTKVGSFPGGASPYGAMDMSGNVWEWVDDWYQPYPGNHYPDENYGQKHKVVRGGSWVPPYILDEFISRTTVRSYRLTDYRADDIGFRCLMGPPKPTPTPVPTPTPTNTPDVSRWEEMILIPAGEFLRGASENDPWAQATKKPQYMVYLDAYYIDKYEVTNAQYVAFLNDLGANRWACRSYDCIYTEDGKYSERLGHILYADEHYEVEAGYERYPVVEVTWYGADEYCWHYGLRLPTDAEWEKAARGTDGRLYPWGDEWDPDKVTFGLAPVGSHPEGASPYGVLDMSGSVWEWVADWSGLQKIQRGGGQRSRWLC